MKTPAMLAGILLLTTFFSYGLDPPVKVWEKWYYTNYDYAYFRDIELAPSGNLLVTGLIYDYTPPADPRKLGSYSAEPGRRNIVGGSP